MKNSKHLLGSLFVIIIFTGFAAAQNYVSTKGGFSIALPASGATIETIPSAEGQGENIKWDMKEGQIVITYVENAPGVTFKTAKDIAFFFEGVKQGIVEIKPTSLVEADYSAGSFYGTAFNATVNGNPFRTRALAAMGTKYFIISGLAYADQPAADKLILKAMDSFSLTPAPAK